MSALEELAAMQATGPDPIAAAEQLGTLLDLPSVGLGIRGARIVGRGSSASADVYLSDGSEITFDSLRDVATPKALALEVAASTGATPNLKAPQAIRAVALLRAIADHHATVTGDHISEEWGTAFLQSASTVPLDLNDQQARWAAFSTLERVDPVARARAEVVSVAQASLVLAHIDGTRLVRCGWFRAHVRQEDSNVSAQEVAARMQRVGWQRRGQSGRIKATRPGTDGYLAWSFYSVPSGWEDRR